MNSRVTKSSRKSEVYYVTASMDMFIERLRKIRALNGDPSLFGMDHYVLKRLIGNKLSILTRS